MLINCLHCTSILGSQYILKYMTTLNLHLKKSEHECVYLLQHDRGGSVTDYLLVSFKCNASYIPPQKKTPEQNVAYGDDGVCKYLCAQVHPSESKFSQ